MPTDLPPDYKPRPLGDAGKAADATDPSSAPATGEDSVDVTTGVKQPVGGDAGLPGSSDGDVVDPTGLPGDGMGGVPAPAGMPTI